VYSSGASPTVGADRVPTRVTGSQRSGCAESKASLVFEGRLLSEEPHDNRPLCAGLKTGVEHVPEDSMAGRVQVPCRRLLRERGDSFLSLPGSRFGADLGHAFTATPEVSGVRSIVHVVLFLTFFYLGFIRKWKSRSIN